LTASQLNERLSQLESQMKIKENEVTSLKNEKRLMIKQLSERKIDQSQSEETLKEV